MDIRTRIRELRHEAGYSQFVVALFLHISQKTVSDYEIGKFNIPAAKLIRLAELYDVSMDYLCCLTDIRSSFPKERDLSDLHPDEVEFRRYPKESDFFG